MRAVELALAGATAARAEAAATAAMIVSRLISPP
jgi:hypothetical protein